MDFKVIEAKWQKYWAEHPELYSSENSKAKNINSKKEYVLVEFPYPSGSGLHVGHAFSFTGADIYARYKRMQGNNVLFPMGWDAFGLPTENYAIKSKRKPQEVTRENTEMFKSQMKKLAYSFDWEREVNTTDPDYYKWTQWIFIQLFKKDLAHKEEMPINWCPSCKIGLANEEVVNGKCERCGGEVERRTISQWVVNITKYADKLIEGLEKTDFIDKVKQAQINWIGKSEGAKVKFQILNPKAEINELEVFTTRPDTLPGVTFMVMAPEHELIKSLQPEADPPLAEKSKIETEKWEEIENYIKNSRKKSDLERTELAKDKTGVFSGLYAINPYNNKEIPIWISDFVLASYGTGAIMAVPACDERDHEFAKKFGLPIVPVVEEKDGYEKMVKWIEDKKIGERSASYHLRDWIFSRQHYWGEPIPMIFCSKCGWVPEKEENLPVELPEIEAYEPTDDGQSPLSKIDNFIRCNCPKCGGEAKRETDTMPNWAGSDWYYLAYCFAKKINKENKAKKGFIDIFSSSQEEVKKWLPVDVYIGGDEHNTLHLLYSRFIYQFLYDIGVVPKEIPEPYFKRISHGVILGPDNQRMSKSKGNVIVPETIADIYGVDVLRLYLMFMGPFTGTMAWNEKTLMGVKRFIDRFNSFIDKQIKYMSDSSNSTRLIINKTIKGVSNDLDNFGFNTAIAKMMEAVNEIDKAGKDDLKKLVQLLAPMAPYTAEEAWKKLGETSSVHESSWPEYSSELLISEMVILPVAINGKVREKLEIERDRAGDKEYIMRLVEKNDKIKKWLLEKKIVKEILVSGKMLNLVIKE
ncbi:MAG TPA: class I tRNA ligase family protein [Candidatus Woesebacteria bacterium]|nr:class I tRNA ligase family protein [Candidatus Woesebacteria bacterium]HPR99506.1 class I tRNA ligase family protein [Candidatus Woesebacteria bacterium]